MLKGTGKFESPHIVAGEDEDGKRRVSFDQCIIAAGSSVARIPGLPYDDPRLIDSTGALALADIPKRMLVIGGGIIGLEMACVYDALGAKVTVVELLDGLIPGADRDLVRPLESRIEKRYEAILLNTKVAKLEARPKACSRRSKARKRARAAAATTACCSPWAAGPTGATSAPRRPA